MKTESHVDKARRSIKYKIIHFVWVKGNEVSRWAGKQLVKIVLEADKKD